MVPTPNSSSRNGQAPAQTPLSSIAEALERVRQGHNDDIHLFPLLASLVRTLGRPDAEAEFQARAEHARTGQSPETFRVLAAGAEVPRLDGPATRANTAAAESYLQRGLELFKQGKFAEAEQEYHRAIRLKPDLAEAHGNLGVLLGRQRRLAEAEAAFRLALQFNPTNVAAYTNLGTACLDQGRATEAETWFRQAILIRPDLADGHRLLGTALESGSKWKAAEAALRDAIRLQPGMAESHYRLARVLKRQQQFKEAEAAYREAVRLRPEHADSWNNLGVLLEDQGRHADAEPCCREALRRQPRNAEFHNNLGVVLATLDRLQEAEASYREALRLQPDNAAAFNNLGNCLRNQNRLEEAKAALRNAIRLAPRYAEAHNNLGIVIAHSGQVAEGLALYDEALRLRPDYPEAHLNRSLAWLSSGEFARGWPEYEWRWKMPNLKAPKFAQPRWDGSPLGSRTLLLCAEQGLGDTVQFVRYASLVRGSEGKVLLDCPPALVELLASCPGVDQVIPRGEKLPPFDVHIPLLSIPGLVDTRPDNIPAPIPYLKADPARVEFWRKELSGVEGFRVGIAWQGSKQHRGDRNRSVRLVRFAALAAVPGVRLISLQKGEGVEQLPEAAAAGWSVLDYSSRLGPSFADTAALLHNLDLVVTVDTAVAHVAGALGLPVWVLLGHAADWRWLRGREDTPWYPTMHLFRQPALQDWDTVFDRITRAVREEVQRKRPAGKRKPKYQLAAATTTDAPSGPTEPPPSIPDPLLSVVIPCYNGAAFLKDTVQSVLSQEIRCEVILVDDGSTDETLFVARQLQQDNPDRVHCVCQANQGAARARNVGFRLAQGKYVGFLDADDQYAPGFAAAALKALESDDTLVGVTCPIEMVNLHRPIQPWQQQRVESAIPSNLIVRAQTVQSIGGFPEGVAFRGRAAGEDCAFREQVRRCGPVLKLDQVLVRYLVRQGSHFDLFLDRFVEKQGRLESLFLTPEEADGSLQRALDEYRVGVERRQTRLALEQLGECAATAAEFWHLCRTFDRENDSLRPLVGYLLYWLGRNWPLAGQTVATGSLPAQTLCWLAAGCKAGKKGPVAAVQVLPRSPAGDLEGISSGSLPEEGRTLLKNLGLEEEVAWSTLAVPDETLQWTKGIRLLLLWDEPAWSFTEEVFAAWAPFVMRHGLVVFPDRNAESGGTPLFGRLRQDSAPWNDLLCLQGLGVLQKRS